MFLMLCIRHYYCKYGLYRIIFISANANGYECNLTINNNIHLYRI